MGAKRILTYSDVPNWILRWMAEEVAAALPKYEFHLREHNYRSSNGLVKTDEEYDLVWIMQFDQAVRLLDLFETDNRRPFNGRVVTGFHSFRELEVYGIREKLRRFPVIDAVSKELQNILCHYLQHHSYYTPSGVDADKYHPRSPEEEAKREVVEVGWAGNHRTSAKRVYLLDLIDTVTVTHTRQIVAPEEMPDWFRRLDAYICLSRDEGGPRPLLEAMASGLPVVTTKVGIV